MPWERLINKTAFQILLHPYVHLQQLPILEYAALNGIVVEAYSALMWVPLSSIFARI